MLSVYINGIKVQDVHLREDKPRNGALVSHGAPKSMIRYEVADDDTVVFLIVPLVVGLALFGKGIIDLKGTNAIMVGKKRLGIFHCEEPTLVKSTYAMENVKIAMKKI
jgi:hypothetical protein